jgi:hypothetical protein
VLPEAIWQSHFVLARGAVCNDCNGYLGKLDSAVAGETKIAACIQTFALPGKAGKPRQSLGRFQRRGPSEIRVTYAAGDELERVERRWSFELGPPRGWSQWKFNRGLHHIAFNFLAWATSLEFVLREDFNPARKYVRQPDKGETWPYSFATLGATPRPEIDLTSLQEGPGRLVGIKLFNLCYFVDLLNTGEGHEWIRSKANAVEWSLKDAG